MIQAICLLKSKSKSRNIKIGKEIVTSRMALSQANGGFFTQNPNGFLSPG